MKSARLLPENPGLPSYLDPPDKPEDDIRKLKPEDDKGIWPDSHLVTTRLVRVVQNQIDRYLIRGGWSGECKNQTPPLLPGLSAPVWRDACA